MNMRVVMLGDVVGTPGRLAVAQLLPRIRQQWAADVVIVNAENCCQGSGLMPEQYDKLKAAGVDGMTLGDHALRRKQIVQVLERESDIIRPANLPAKAPGRGWMKVVGKAADGRALPPVYVITVLGQRFMSINVDDPFKVVDEAIAGLPELRPIVLVEFHAETTGEKEAMGWHLAGRATAVVGTHTHVATADERILPRKAAGERATAYITDIGMCGARDSVLGRQTDAVLKHLTTGVHVPFDVAEGNPWVSGVCIEIDPVCGDAVSIERVELAADVRKPPFVAG